MADALRVIGQGGAGLRCGPRRPSRRDQPRACASARRQVASRSAAPSWHERSRRSRTCPLIVIANEFFDALPVSQFVRRGRAWHERARRASEGGDLAFGLVPGPIAATDLPRCAGGRRSSSAARPAVAVDERDRSAGSPRRAAALLAIDYGHVPSRASAIRCRPSAGHAFADPLARPGRSRPHRPCRLRRACRVAEAQGAAIDLVTTQADFLQRSGIDARAAALKARATPAQARAASTSPSRGSPIALRRGMGVALQGAGDPRRAGLTSPRCGRDPVTMRPEDDDRADALSALPATHAPGPARLRHGFFTRQGGVSDGHLCHAERRPGLVR